MLEKVYPGAAITGASILANEYKVLPESLAIFGAIVGAVLAGLGAYVHCRQGPGKAGDGAW